LWKILRNSQPNDDLSELDADTLNNHFVNITKKLQPKAHSPFDTPRPSALPQVKPDIPPLNEIPHISPQELTLHFHTISVNKATGTDKLSVRLMRLAFPYILNPLTDIMNRCIYEGTFPDLWKAAIVTPLYKGGPKSNPSNYRPISVLPILSKVFQDTFFPHFPATLLQTKSLASTNLGSEKITPVSPRCSISIHLA
jgi:hypothetical protein